MGFGGLAGLAGGILTGDTKIGSDYRNFYRQVRGDYGQAGADTQAALSSLNERDAAYNQQLQNGVLPQELKDAFARRRGVLNDDEMRRRRQFSTMLAQQRAQSGGQLSDAAAMEFQTQNERDQMENRRAAEADISGQEGSMILDETNKLYDRIDQIRQMRLGVAQSERDRAIGAMLGALGGRKAYVKESSEEARSWVSMFMGGGAKGGVTG